MAGRRIGSYRSRLLRKSRFCADIGSIAQALTRHPISITWVGVQMRFQAFSFGSIRIDGVTYPHDVVIDRGQVRERNKKASKKLREAYGHTPLSMGEDIPWKCRRVVIGTGTGALPVMEEVKDEANRRHIELVILPVEEDS